MVDLKPCPFCGGNAEELDLEDDANFGGSVICCQKCGASSPVHFDRKENLYDSWNRRTEAKQDDEPVAWRWKPKDSAAWIYNPKPEWLEAQSRDEIDAEPLYTRPSEQAVTQAMVRAAAEILIGRVNAPEQEIYTATRDALKAAMEARDAE